jgi:poly(3-hydroxybutyrate) depolymerase
VLTTIAKLAACLVLIGLGACTQRESLGANCMTPIQACAGKSCGDVCIACSAASATPDVTGRCGADGTCTTVAPICGGGADASTTLKGCGKPGAATGVLKDQFVTVAGQKRTYVLSVPTNYSGASPLALVFVWHGANMDGDLSRTTFGLESQANGAAIFAYPNGVTADTWDLSTTSIDVQFFTTLLNAISTDYCIDANRVFSTGYSAGAFMTNTLGCYFGGVVRAIAPVAGGGPPSMMARPCTTKVAAILVHGRNDQVVALSAGQGARDYLILQSNCTSQTAAWPPEPACVAYQGCQSGLPLVWCVHDEGHAWPNLSTNCTGGTCMDAGAAIWSFFSSFH